MATGIEIAGLVLAAVPMLMKAPESMAGGIAVTKRYDRYRVLFNQVVQGLKSENAILKKSLAIILSGVIPRSMMEQFLVQPNGVLWRRMAFEGALRARLEQSYDPYIDAVSASTEASTISERGLCWIPRGSRNLWSQEVSSTTTGE